MIAKAKKDWRRRYPTRARKNALAVKLSFDPNQTILINHIEATLVMEEIADITSRTSTSQYRHNIKVSKARLCAAKRIEKYDFVTCSVNITLPKGMLPSIKTDNNWLEWKVTSHIVDKGITQSIDHYFDVVSML